MLQLSTNTFIFIPCIWHRSVIGPPPVKDYNFSFYFIFLTRRLSFIFYHTLCGPLDHCHQNIFFSCTYLAYKCLWTCTHIACSGGLAPLASLGVEPKWRSQEQGDSLDSRLGPKDIPSGLKISATWPRCVKRRQHFLAPFPGINIFIPEYDFCFLPFLFFICWMNAYSSSLIFI